MIMDSQAKWYAKQQITDVYWPALHMRRLINYKGPGSHVSVVWERENLLFTMIQFVSVVTFLHSSIFIQIKLLRNKSKWNKNFDIVSTDDCTVPLKIKMALKYGNSSRLRPSSLQISQNFKGGDFRDQPRPVLWRNPLVRDSHYIESKQFLFCTSKQWLLIVFLQICRLYSQNGLDMTLSNKLGKKQMGNT